MVEGIRTFIYPVIDLAKAKPLCSRLLGVEPYVDDAYCVGFRVAGQEIGLDPHGHSRGMTGPGGYLEYLEVDDIQTSVHALLDAGCGDAGGHGRRVGALIASVRDADGSVPASVQSSDGTRR
jgi:hypothetical protein